MPSWARVTPRSDNNGAPPSVTVMPSPSAAAMPPPPPRPASEAEPRFDAPRGPAVGWSGSNPASVEEVSPTAPAANLHEHIPKNSGWAQGRSWRTQDSSGWAQGRSGWAQNYDHA